MFFAIKCPQSVSLDRDRIINGTPARPGQFPHHAAVRCVDEDGQVVAICSGSLTGHRWVLSAGSCVQRCSVVEVGLGSIHFNSPALVVRTNIVHVHPRWRTDEDVRFNIAVLEFAHDIPYSSNIRPILLDEVQCVHCAKDTLLVSGFGQSGECENDKAIDNKVTIQSVSLYIPGNKPLDRLQYVRVQLTTTNECRQYFPAPMICTTGYFFAEQCPFENDAGAALIVRGPEPEELYLQIGLFAASTPTGCVHGDPVAYVDVSLFIDWIKSFGV